MWASLPRTAILSAACLISLGATPALAADCSSYPFRPGTDITPVEGSDFPKMLATERAIPFSEDLADVDDAYNEAELSAKTEFSKFLNETVSSEERIDESVEKISETQGDERSASSTRVKEIFTSMASSSQALLRGVVVLGDCYTPGREVRVTVGIKPETIAQATGLASGINNSLDAEPTPSAPQSADNPSSEAPAGTDAIGDAESIRRAEGSSNTDRLDDF